MRLAVDALMRKLPGRQIDGDAHGAYFGTLPLGNLSASGLYDPIAYCNDQSGFLENRDEIEWGNQAVPGTIPAQQRFDARDASSREIDFWLIVKHEFVALERFAKGALGVEFLDG